MAVTNDNGGFSAKLAAAEDALTGRFKVRKIIWAGGTTAAHAIAIKDDDKAKVILEATLGTVQQTHQFDFDPPIQFTDGMSVSTLGSGYVYVFFA
jgi:hypothetical protein